MSHYRVLMIGSEANLNQIFADCPDSSSVTTAEMAFGYDYMSPIPFSNGKIEFTKKDPEFKKVEELHFTDVWDIRDNTCDTLVYNYDDELQHPVQVLEYIDDLPDDTVMFYVDAHL